MKKFTLSVIHLAIALLVLVFMVAKLEVQDKPEMIPYRIIPIDYLPGDCRLEFGVEMIQPYQIENLVEVHKEETLEIIYERIAYEMVNPNHTNQIFKIDGKLYFLIRVPYTGTIWNDISYQ